MRLVIALFFPNRLLDLKVERLDLVNSRIEHHFFVVAVIYVIYELNRVYEGSSGIKRLQIKYLILAFFIGFSGGVTSYPPVYGVYEIYPVWNGTILIFKEKS